jgi:hypothetical protein
MEFHFSMIIFFVRYIYIFFSEKKLFLNHLGRERAHGISLSVSLLSAVCINGVLSYVLYRNGVILLLCFCSERGWHWAAASGTT